MGVDEFAKKYSDEFFKAIEEIEVSDGLGKHLGFVGGIELSLEILKQLQNANHKIFIVGNGGSAAIASHAAMFHKLLV